METETDRDIQGQTYAHKYRTRDMCRYIEILTGIEAGKHAILQSVSQSGRHPCMHAARHAYIHREKERPTYI